MYRAILKLLKERVFRPAVGAAGLLACLFVLAGCDIGQTIGEAAPLSTPTVTRAVAEPTSAVPTFTQAEPTTSVEPLNTPEVMVQSPAPASTATPTDVPRLTPTRRATLTRTRVAALTPTAAGGTIPAPTEQPAQTTGGGVTVNGVTYDAYVPAATKKHQYFHYTCEFDAAWVVLKTYGIDATLQDQVDLIGLDKSIEPRYEETKDGIVIYGGDITTAYSGDYAKNFLARSSGQAMRKVFEHYGLRVTPVNTRETLEAALLRGELVWIKTTADFKPGKPATWIMPDGRTYKTVLGNDHAAVVMGFSERGALIRDVLGPTSTNWNRTYEYEVPWPKFLAAWASQSFDGLAVAPPGN